MNPNYYELILVTHRNQIAISDYCAFIQQCAVSGITAVQLREKEASLNFILELGFALKKVLAPFNIPLIINDHVEIALKLDAAGVHLGQSDLSVLQAREKLGPDKIIGLSIESEEELAIANQLPVNYVSASSIFFTQNKSHIKRIWGLDGLKKLKGQSKHPLIGIGGIHESNIRSVLKAGVEGVAVIGALHNAKNLPTMTALLRDLLREKR